MNLASSKELGAFINGTRVGTITQHLNGSLSFRYEQGYSGIPLSLCMPVSNLTYDDAKVRPYLFGLLPENDEARRSIATEHGVSANNPFALVGCIGLDLPGAIQISADEDLVREGGQYERITVDEIERRLAEIIESDRASWFAPSERWSLGGQQSKIALARFDDEWFRCEGSAATTHIIKPGVKHLKEQAFNEHFCLRLANACGIAAAKSELVFFGNIPAIVVSRFDREIIAPFNVKRIHQEDLCQALSVSPRNKYTEDGGPSTRDVIDILDCGNHARENIMAFTTQLFFNNMIGATDAHAKNYSVLHEDETGFFLSPMYDVASILPYKHEKERIKLAMSIGGENRLFRLSAGNLRRHAEIAELDEGLVRDFAGNLAENIIDNLEDVKDKTVMTDEQEELAGKLVSGIRRSCEAVLKAVESC